MDVCGDDNCHIEVFRRFLLATISFDDVCHSSQSDAVCPHSSSAPATLIRFDTSNAGCLLPQYPYFNIRDVSASLQSSRQALWCAIYPAHHS